MDVKNELLKHTLGTSEENYAELLGIISFSNWLNFFKEKYPINLKVKVNLLIEVLNQEQKLNLPLLIEKNIEKNYFSRKKAIKFINNPKFSIFSCHFLRGVFLACGNVTNPMSNYHLEFLLKNEFYCNLLIEALSKVEATKLNPKISKKKSGISVYMKGHEQITDFLTFIGATNSSMKYIQTKMLKEVRNYVNRTTNFETANLTKTSIVAYEQVKAIKELIKSKNIDSLPSSLKETALLRLQNPYMSLEELSHLFSKPITKSGVNYRIKKLLNYLKSL